jgi:DNA gyrase subunit B
VIILSDADQDGAHIRAILLTFFFRYMRELVTEGHVFIGMPPLYKCQKGANTLYCYDDRSWTRPSKNWARLRAAALQGPGRDEPRTALGDHHEPENRKLIQVTLEDAPEAERLVTC